MSKKQIVILCIVVIVIIALSSFLFIKTEEKKSYSLYLFTGDTKMVKWYYNNSKWYIVNTNEKLADPFDVYSNGKYKGSYDLVYNNKWYYFDEDNKNVQIDGINFMINTNYNFTSYAFDVEYKKNDNLVEQIAEELNINYNKFTYNLKTFKISNNDKLKTIYSVDFYEKNDEYVNLGPSYTAVFYTLNNKIYVIKYLEFSQSNKDYCSLSINGVFTFENDNNKILLSCTYFDQIPSDYYLYENNKNKYELVVDSKGGV